MIVVISRRVLATRGVGPLAAGRAYELGSVCPGGLVAGKSTSGSAAPAAAPGMLRQVGPSAGSLRKWRADRVSRMTRRAENAGRVVLTGSAGATRSHVDPRAVPWIALNFSRVERSRSLDLHAGPALLRKRPGTAAGHGIDRRPSPEKQRTRPAAPPQAGPPIAAWARWIRRPVRARPAWPEHRA